MSILKPALRNRLQVDQDRGVEVDRRQPIAAAEPSRSPRSRPPSVTSSMHTAITTLSTHASVKWVKLAACPGSTRPTRPPPCVGDWPSSCLPFSPFSARLRCWSPACWATCRPAMPCRRRSTTSSPPPGRARCSRSRRISAPSATSSPSWPARRNAIDAARAFRATFDELNRTDVPVDLRRKVDAWYGTEFMPGMRRLSARSRTSRIPARRSGRLLSAVPLHRRQPLSARAARAGRRCRRRQRLQRPARDLPSAAAGRRHDLRLLRPDAGGSGGQPHRLCRQEGSRFRRLPPQRSLPALQSRRGRRALWRRCREVRRLPGRLRALCALGWRADCLHGRADHRAECRRRRADRAIVDRRNRQGRDRRTALATGRVRRHRRGLSRRIRQPRAVRAACVL